MNTCAVYVHESMLYREQTCGYRKDRHLTVSFQRPNLLILLVSTTQLSKQKMPSRPLIPEIFSNQVAKENQNDRDHSLKCDRYGTCSSGTTVRDACINPCSRANRDGGSQNIDH